MGGRNKGGERQIEETECERGGNRAWNTEERGNELSNEANFLDFFVLFKVSCGVRGLPVQRSHAKGSYLNHDPKN